MKLKFRPVKSTVQFERLLTFASDIFTINDSGYYIRESELKKLNIPLYIQKPEDEQIVYYFSQPASEFVRQFGLGESNSSGEINLSQEFMKNFDLIRVIPPNGHVPIDSFLRVVKNDNDNPDCYNIEELTREGSMRWEDLINKHQCKSSA